MRSFVTLSVVLLAASASASAANTITLRKLNRNGMYLHRAVDADHARVMYLKSRTASGPTIVPAMNPASIWYTTRVGIGNPAAYYNLIVDTGSSNTFCGIGTSYVRTPTSIPTGESVSINYGMGNITGEEYLDQVTIAPNLVLKNQSIGNANSSYGLQGVDGILGLGAKDLTRGKLSPDRNETIPTVMDNLVTQGVIMNNILGIYFAPSINDTDTYGALTYGGVDSSLYKGELHYAPLTVTYPAAEYWGINASATYGNCTVIPNSTAGIVDSGSTLIHLADEFFSTYSTAIGGSLDAKTRMLEIPASSISTMQSLNLSIGDRTFTMDPAAQLFPRDQNILFGGDPDKHYGVVNNLRSLGKPGLGFVLGMAFFERYYVVLDADAKRIGFAETNNTFTTY